MLWVAALKACVLAGFPGYACRKSGLAPLPLVLGFRSRPAHIQGDSPMRAFCGQRVCTAPLSGSSVSWLLLRLHSSDVFFASMGL